MPCPMACSLKIQCSTPFPPIFPTPSTKTSTSQKLFPFYSQTTEGNALERQGFRLSNYQNIASGKSAYSIHVQLFQTSIFMPFSCAPFPYANKKHPESYLTVFFQSLKRQILCNCRQPSISHSIQSPESSTLHDPIYQKPQKHPEIFGTLFEAFIRERLPKSACLKGRDQAKVGEMQYLSSLPQAGGSLDEKKNRGRQFPHQNSKCNPLVV